MVTLQNKIYTRLDKNTWCATAEIKSQEKPQFLYANALLSLPSVTSLYYQAPLNTLSLYWNNESALSTPQKAFIKRQQQRQSVRLLLQDMLTDIGINDTLNDENYPYRLVNNGYYICFSHSDNAVAAIINSHHAVGIDIETQPIKWKVVQRFYHPDEVSLLNEMSNTSQNIVAKWLWQLKESCIKIHQHTLAQGLGISYADIIPKLRINAKQDSIALPIIHIDTTIPNYHIAILPRQQLLVVF